MDYSGDIIGLTIMEFNKDILYRTLIASIGGYLFCVATSFSFSPIFYLLFNIEKSQAILLSTNLSYLFYVGFIIWSYCAASIAALVKQTLILLLTNIGIYLILTMRIISAW